MSTSQSIRRTRPLGPDAAPTDARPPDPVSARPSHVAASGITEDPGDSKAGREHVVTVWRDDKVPDLADTMAVHAECRASDTAHLLYSASNEQLAALASAFFDVTDPVVRSLLVADHEARCELGLATGVVVGRVRHGQKASAR